MVFRLTNLFFECSCQGDTCIALSINSSFGRVPWCYFIEAQGRDSFSLISKEMTMPSTTEDLTGSNLAIAVSQPCNAIVLLDTKGLAVTQILLIPGRLRFWQFRKDRFLARPPGRLAKLGDGGCMSFSKSGDRLVLLDRKVYPERLLDF